MNKYIYFLHNKNQRHILKILFTILIVYGLYVALVSLPNQKEINELTILPTLYVPERKISLSGPLILNTVSTSVLGAQTLDPTELIDHINIERKNVGAPPLIISPTLTKAAQKRANVIIKYQNFSHYDPHEGIELASVLPELNYQYKYASENIGMGGLSGADFVNGFMHSTFHRENLLNPQLKETGVAIVSGPYEQYYVNIAVQIFADPAQSKNEYLGYTDTDKKTVKQAKKNLNAQIVETKKRMRIDSTNKPHYEAWLKFLILQESLVEKIYNQMLKDKPIIGEFIHAIEQYNTNWENTPKLPKG